MPSPLPSICLTHPPSLFLHVWRVFSKAAWHSSELLSPAQGSTQMGLALRVRSCHRLQGEKESALTLDLPVSITGTGVFKDNWKEVINKYL